jgi:hypothetical protein
MAWPSSQLWEIRTDIPRIISGFEANLHLSCGEDKSDPVERDEKNWMGQADETAGPADAPIETRTWPFGEGTTLIALVLGHEAYCCICSVTRSTNRSAYSLPELKTYRS